MSHDSVSSGSAEAVVIENLRFSYPTSGEVLSGIDLRVQEGEFVCIAGPTGAGKTTLCMCMKGLIPHTQPGKLIGRVLIHGQDTRKIEPGKLARTVGMVFQDPEAQIIGLTVAEDLAYGPENYEVPPDQIMQRIPEILELVRLKGYGDRETYSLSGGEKQRVAIAGALMMVPRVLILDEPTSELDPIGKTEILKVLQNLREQHGMTIIVVEHALEQLAELADRIIVLDKGQIVAQDTPRKLFRRVDLFEAIGGERAPQVADVLSRLERDGLLSEDRITPFEDEAVQVLSDMLEKCETTALGSYTGPVEEVQSQGEYVVDVRDVSFKYDTSPEAPYALEHANLQVREGEFIAFIGQNGAGKTTLAKLLNGTLKPVEGTVLIRGEDTRESAVDDMARTVGYCYQNPDHQIFAGTVYEEVAFGPRNIGIDSQEIDKRVMDSLESVGLADEKDTYPFVLGRGQRQLLAVASVAAMGVQILVVDEPTTGMDLSGTRNIMALLSEWNRRGHTVVIITHDMNVVSEYVPRTVVLAAGRIVADGPTISVFNNKDVLSTAYLAPPQITRLGQKLAKYGFPSNVLTVRAFYGCLRNILGLPLNVR